MSASKNTGVEQLREHRTLLLGCEAIGWVHMINKADPGFLREQGRQKGVYRAPVWKQVLPTVADLSWLRNKWNISGKPCWPIDNTNFLLRHHERKGQSQLLGLLQSAHGVVSGIEKNYPGKEFVSYLCQDVTHLWRTSPFGHPERNLLVDPPPGLRPGGFEQILAEIERIFGELKDLIDENDTSNTGDTDELLSRWAAWRCKAIGNRSLLRNAFLETLAETRVPNNDVTLWDQSYMTAALFKSAVAAFILASNSSHHSVLDAANLRTSTRWRVLIVGIGVEHYEERAVRIGDWTGARDQIRIFFDKVCELVEVDLAVGSLIYRDDQTLAFTFPGEWFEEANASKNLESKEGANDQGHTLYSEALLAIRDWIETEVMKYAESYSFETPPIVHLSDPTRSLVPMAENLDRARSALATPFHDGTANHRFTVKDGGERRGHTCPVCMVRANGKDNEKGGVCRVCEDRRQRRLEAWRQDRVEGDSIWISEVADQHDRLALVTMSLGIDGWLSGEHVDSLRAQAIGEWLRFNPYLKGTPNPISDHDPVTSLSGEIHTRLQSWEKTQNVDTNDFLMTALQTGFQYEDSWQRYFHKVVEDRALAPSWDQLNPEERARWFAHQLFRKYAAPGRIFRFWRTTADFFERLLIETRQIASRSKNRWRTRRLVIEPKGSGFKEGRTYHGVYRGAPVGFVKLPEGLVTITNLARVLDAADESLMDPGRSIELTEDDTGELIQLEIMSNPKPSHRGVYHPVIPLEVSPLRFRALVPLEVVDSVVRVAHERWAEEFGRVWDRLPIRIGVVAFTRMTPFQGVVEAVRNLEADLSIGDRELWRVERVIERDGVNSTLWVRPDNERELVTTPMILPDGRVDHFYPYLEVKDNRLRFPRDFERPAVPNGPGRAIFRHISDLRVGDAAYVQPSRICKVFLESTADRFAENSIQYLSDAEVQSGVWDLVRGTNATTSALRNAYQTITRAYDEWLGESVGPGPNAQETWLEFAGAVLHGQLGVRDGALSALVDAARTGALFRSLYWNIHVLKANLEGDDA